MAAKLARLRWGVEQRLEFIEFHLFWEGGLNRANIIDQFGVSVPQASNDLSHYQRIAPDNIRYDRSEKRYFAAEGFAPVFFTPDANGYLTHLQAISEGTASHEETWLSQVPAFEVLPMPHRNIDPLVLQAVLTAIRNQRALEIRYQSLSAEHPKPMWRWITPHAFGFDGMRWHTRAFCHMQRKFLDFLLPRILGVRKEADPGASPEDDCIWSERTEVALKPHPKLTSDQQAVIAQDFGMKKGVLRVGLRLALLYYFLRRLGLDFNEESRDPREQHVVLANPDDVRAALARAQYAENS